MMNRRNGQIRSIPKISIQEKPRWVEIDEDSNCNRDDISNVHEDRRKRSEKSQKLAKKWNNEHLDVGAEEHYFFTIIIIKRVGNQISNLRPIYREHDRSTAWCERFLKMGLQYTRLRAFRRRPRSV